MNQVKRLLKNMKFDLNFEREPLFNIEITFEKELDTGEVTNNFKQKFKENSHPLSETILIMVVINQEKWYIQDQDTKNRYILIKEGNMITIYRYQPYSTVLVEQTTNSRFRVVTADKCLTNSFWNFYI